MEEPTAKPTPIGNDSYRSVPTPFLTKTYQLVDDESIDHVISWNDDGSTFIVWNTMAFAKDLLPKYFKHNNFTSFLRQLNTYGFRKVVSDRWEFANECFRKGKKQLLCEIQRRKLTGPVSSTASNAAVVTTVGASAIPSVQLLTLTGNSSGEEQVISSDESPRRALAELIDENDRLRKEKVELTEQLVEVKSLCNNIFSLMSSFVESQFKSSFKVRESVLTSAKSLDLFPVKRPSVEDVMAEVKEEETNQMCAKRAREYREGATETAEDDTTLRLQPPDRSVVKSERINCENKVDEENRWHNQVH